MNIDDFLEKLFAFAKAHVKELVFLAFIGVSYWLVYGLGHVIGSHLQQDETVELAGKKPLVEIQKLAEDGQASGRVIIGDKTKFKDQYGNVWLVPDFNRAVSKESVDKLKSNGIQVEGDVRVETIHANSGARQAAVAGFIDSLSKIVLALFYVIVIYFMFTQIRASSGGGGGLFSKPFRRVLQQDGSESKITFANVAGHQGPKAEIVEIVEYLKDPDRFKRAGARPPRGVLLYGPPGNGKTLIAKALAGEANAGFLEQNASSFMQMFVGMGAMRVRDLFKEARKQTPCVIFIDEIDSIGGHRGGGSGGGHDERLQTVNALLAELDGFGTTEGIVVIAATNRLEQLDEALIRPGRFDRKVFVPLPGKSDRKEILEVHAKKIPQIVANLATWAERTQGFSGADLANLVNEAAMEAARKNQIEVGDPEFSRAKDRILMGPRNHGHVLTERERRVIAYHEAGHACMRVLGKHGTLEKVSILPHGMALGVTVSSADEERLLLTKDEVLNELLVMMGGRAAEEVFIGEITSGAANDMERASQLARTAITRYGFDAFGPYVPEHSEMTKEIELKAAAWVRDAYEQAKSILASKKPEITEIVRILLDNDEMLGHDAEVLLLGEAPVLLDKPLDGGSTE